MFTKQSKNRVLTLTMWNLIMPIGVVTLANLINEVDLIPNCTLIMPYMVVLSYILVSSL